jgi:hypothetical protein
MLFDGLHAFHYHLRTERVDEGGDCLEKNWAFLVVGHEKPAVHLDEIEIEIAEQVQVTKAGAEIVERQEYTSLLQSTQRRADLRRARGTTALGDFQNGAVKHRSRGLPDVIDKTPARQMSGANIHGNVPVINARRLPDIDACLAQYKAGQRTDQRGALEMHDEMIRAYSTEGFVAPSDQCLDADARGGADVDDWLVYDVELAATQALSRGAQKLCSREKADRPLDSGVVYARSCCERRDEASHEHDEDLFKRNLAFRSIRSPCRSEFLTPSAWRCCLVHAAPAASAIVGSADSRRVPPN